MNEYGIKSTINHEAHAGHKEKTLSINVLNLHALHGLHGYFFYIEYFHSLPSLARQVTRRLAELGLRVPRALPLSAL